MRAKAGATAGSPRHWTPASPLSSGPGASWSRKGSRRCWPANTTRTPPGWKTGPLVCLDETSKKLIIGPRAPIPAKPGQPARHDYEYERNGVANLFMVFAPLEGWRHVKVTDRHTAIDYAHMLRDLSDTHFPDAAKIVLVQDNLNIHKPASLYEALPAPEARRLVERFEWHYTPKHGSWLDLAESELGVLASQCLDRRIADKQIL